MDKWKDVEGKILNSAKAESAVSAVCLSLVRTEDIRFDDDPERRLPLAVDEPVDEVAAHLGGGVVEAEEAPVVLQAPRVSQLHRERHALVLLLLGRQLRQGRGDVCG